MDQKYIWSAYILALQKILAARSAPIAVLHDTITLAGSLVSMEVDQDAHKNTLIYELKSIFQLDGFDFKTDYILQDLAITERIPLPVLMAFREKAATHYMNFCENPLIEGEISYKDSFYTNLLEAIGDLAETDAFKYQRVLFLTLEEKSRLEKSVGNVFENAGRVRLHIRPSIKWLFLQYYNKIKNIAEDGNKITIDRELHPEVYRHLHERIGLTLVDHQVYFVIQNCPDLHARLSALVGLGHQFPDAIGNRIQFWIDPAKLAIAGIDLSDECLRLRRTLKQYLPEAGLSLGYTSKYRYETALLREMLDGEDFDLASFWEELDNELPASAYHINAFNRAISFDFETISELKKKAAVLEEIEKIQFTTISDSQKFRFIVKPDLRLASLAQRLQKVAPGLALNVVTAEGKLAFRQFYRSGDKVLIKDQLRDKLFGLPELKDCRVEFRDSFMEKYLFEEQTAYREEQEQEQIVALKQESFYFDVDRPENELGVLARVNYPLLEFKVDDPVRLAIIKKAISESNIEAVIPELGGETEKVLRLADTIRKLGGGELPNNNAKQFLFDASSALKINNIDALLDAFSPEWMEFEEHLFSSSLNLSQKKAVFKALHAPELALIQGPPGTGKSTAIAEIIWQHLRLNQRQKILLTSETNLAVDNAIDRLKNDRQNIVKPIRFGNSEKLESEGRFYTLEVIDDWVENGEGGLNAVSNWMGNIARRTFSPVSGEMAKALDKWHKVLSGGDKVHRSLFAEQYIRHANLIGATGSSIGKLNSHGKYTGFFRSYLSVFDRKNYFPKPKKKKCNEVEICFDVMIMDEASKATPPELALPVLYSKKAVIVGDHRQLPPMVDGDEIKDILKNIGENALAETISRGAFASSQFEHLFERIDSSIKGTFNTQYRMHPAINDVIAQFYTEDGGLQCGLPLDEASHNSFESKMSRYHGLSFPGLFSPNTHVIWIDVNSPELTEGFSKVNYGEVEAIDQFLTALKRADGFRDMNNWLEGQSEEEKEIGLISFYGKQVNLIQRMLSEKHSDLPFRLSTVDRFQGMEKNIIIVSMVRSNCSALNRDQEPDHVLYGTLGYSSQAMLGFAESPNRLNVALSRARRLLVIVGNKDLFCTKKIYRNVYQSIADSPSGVVFDQSYLRKHVEK